jgi:hypothetical protein
LENCKKNFEKSSILIIFSPHFDLTAAGWIRTLDLRVSCQGRRDTQYNEIQLNDTQRTDTHHNELQHDDIIRIS